MLVGALSFTPLVGSLAAVSLGTPAGAASTAVIVETFQNADVSSPTSWLKPPGPESTANSACLTAGTDTSQAPIPGCSASGGDAPGSGVLQLTNTNGQQEGGALTSVSVPTSNGLDATFDTYQWGGTGADGIGFVIAAEDPSDPVAPTQIGEPGGDLGYAAGAGAYGDEGLADGYLGVGLDVYGNFSNPSFDGTGCPASPSWATGAMPGQVVVRGPGNGGVGYCLLDSSAAADNGTQDLMGSSRAASLVPVEVVLNTTSAAVLMSDTQFESDSVPAGDYGVAWVPLNGSAEFYAGALPSDKNGGIPSGLYPGSWINPTTGIPYQLGFGWVGSTGASTDYHQVSNVTVTTLQPVPVLSAAITDNDNGQLPGGGSVDYTLQAGVTAAGGNENDPITMTATLPSGVMPGSAAAAVGWTCSTAGQIVTCTYAGPVAAGTPLPPVSLPATIETGLATGTSLDSSVTVSSDDGDPATATDVGTVPAPASLTSVTLSTSAPSAAAGIGTVPLDNNGALPTETQQSQVSGTVSGSDNDTANNQVVGLAVGNIALKNIALKNIAVQNIALKNIALKNIATEVAIPGQDPLASVSLSNINVTYPDGCDPTATIGGTNACSGWEGILAGSQYANWPLQSVTLGDVLNTTGQDQTDNLNPEERLDSLNLGDIDLSGSSLGSIPVTAYVLGSASIADVPLSPSDESASNGETVAYNTVSDWCTQMAGLNIPRLTCSALGIDPSNSSTYQNVTPLALGILGVPLSSLSLTSIPVDQSDVDNSPLDSIALKNIALKNIGLGTVALKNIALKNIGLGTVALKNIALKNIGLGAVALKNIALENIGLGTVALKNIALKNIGIGETAVDNIALKNISLGNLPLGDYDVDSLALKNIAVKNISTPSDIVNCGIVDCTSTSTATVGSAYDAGGLASGATLALLQEDAGSDPTFAQTVLSDLYDALTSNGNAADTTTLAELYSALNATGLAADTTTLAEIYSALNPGTSDTTTLADIYGSLNSDGLTSDTTTLADLYGAIDPNDDTTTLGQLIDDLAANDPTDLTGVFLGDLVAGLLPESSYPWQDVNLDTPGLAQASTGGGEVTLTATSTTSGPGALIDYSFTLPAGFSYVPGSALYDGATVADPQVTASSSGVTVTSSDFSVSGTGTDTYAITVAPGESLGAQTPSVTAALTDGSTQSASTSVNVTDPFATTNPASPATLTSDTMNVSFLASPNTPAYWNINLTTAGDELSLDLSNLPADYDLVLYGTATSSLSGAASGDTAEVTETPPADQSTLGQQTDPNEGTIPLLPNRAIEAISATRGLGDEQITTPPLAAGLYTVEVSGYNGAYSTAQPYVLRDEVTPSSPTPSCSVPPTYANDTPTLGETLPTSYPKNVNTLFLVDPDRLLEAYGAGGPGASAPGEQDVISALQNIVAKDVNGMIGAIVPVEGSAQTAADYEAWDANPCSVSAANTVESDINQTVRSIEAANPTVRNVVIVGADDQIPMARIPDQTTSDNESDYGQAEFAGINDQLSAALSQGYFLSDDPYASPTPLLVGGQELYTPSLAVGRLVETPTELVNALNRYVNSGGVLNAKSGLSTGYDFLSQGATAISNALKSDGENITNVISDSWDNTDLLSAINGTASGENGVPNIQSINAHFDFGRVLTAEGDQPGNTDPTQVLQTTDVRSATGPTSSDSNDALLGSVLFSMGCHSGLNIPDNEIENDVPGGLDTWAKTFADEGALWIGNTGFGYANDQYISYSAKLMGLFAANLNGTLDVGEALAQAKQLYVGQSATLDPFDLKSMMESTFYGIPNYTLNVADKPSTTTGSLPTLQLGLDSFTGLTTDSFSISGQTPGSGPSQLGQVTPPEGGAYYEVNNSTLEETAVGFPIEPLDSIDVTDPGSVAHGALITQLGSLDYDDFTPSIAQSDSDTSDDANQVSSLETAFPATLQQVSSYDLFDPATGNPVSHQAVNLITGQYIPNPVDPEQGNQRLFTNVAGSVEYTSPSDTQFTPPTIEQAEGVVTGNQVNFSVLASSPVQGTTVKEVLVLFKDATDGGDTTTGTSVNWTPVWLTEGANGTWSGGESAPSSGKVSFIVQAVDSDGNVTMSSNKGVDFTQVPAVQQTGSGLSGSVTSGNPQTGGYYTTSPVTDTLTGPGTGTPITYSVDGGPTTTAPSPVPVSLSVDGTYTITATDPEGDTATQTVGIETQNPTIDTEVAAPRTGDLWTSGGTTLTISASAPSGIQSLSYTVTPQGGSPGQPQNVANGSAIIDAPEGTTTYAVTATSFAGHTTTKTVTTNVDETAPAVSCTPSPIPTAWQDTQGTVTCTAIDNQSGVAGPNPITLSTSVVAGTSNANAQTNSAQVCDNVGNCTTVGPFTFMVDLTTLVVTASVSAPKSANGYDGPGTVIDASASDSGSGLSSFTYTVTPSGGTAGSSVPVPSNGQIPVTKAGTYTYTFTASSVAGATKTTSVTVSIDLTAPSVVCNAAPTGWQTANVSITCTASDPLAGLPAGTNPITLRTSVAAGTSNANAQTNSAQVCDNVGNCTTVGPLTFMVDLTTPVVTASVSAPKSANGYDGPGTVIDASASDSGSGLSSFTYTVTPAGGTAGSSVPVPSNGQIPVTKAGTYTYTFTASSVAGATKTTSVTVSIDLTAPSVVCNAAPTGWQTANVSITCTASDPLAGLPAGTNPITLRTSVAAGTSNANAQTNSAQVCDNVGNCTTVGPVKGIEVDLTAPNVSVTTPTSGEAFELDQPATASFACSDTGGSGIKACTAKVGTTAVTSGGPLPTSAVGVFTLTITTTSVSGVTTTKSVTYDVTFNLCNVAAVPAPPLSEVTFVLSLCTYQGTNVGSASTTVTAVNVDGTKTPDGLLGNHFVWVQAAKDYGFLMLTTGLAKGSHTLNVSITGDPLGHSVPFKL